MPENIPAGITLGEVCAGYGGIGLGLGMLAPVRTLWVADNEPGPARVLARRHPNAPNLEGNGRTTMRKNAVLAAVAWAVAAPVAVTAVTAAWAIRTGRLIIEDINDTHGGLA